MRLRTKAFLAGTSGFLQAEETGRLRTPDEPGSAVGLSLRERCEKRWSEERAFFDREAKLSQVRPPPAQFSSATKVREAARLFWNSVFKSLEVSRVNAFWILPADKDKAAFS